jgi:hypothetical protein
MFFDCETENMISIILKISIELEIKLSKLNWHSAFLLHSKLVILIIV